MAKQPYIPLYIGDWEQDTNCLSLSAEAAWLKVIFKMFKDEKCGIYKTSTKALQNLWKCRNLNDVSDIIAELADNNICKIELDDGGIVTFFNRRMVREKEISGVRSDSVSKRYKKTSTKRLQNLKKQSTKPLHPLDNDIDTEYDTETVLKGGAGEQKNSVQQKIFLGPEMVRIFKTHIPDHPIDQAIDYPACMEIANKIANAKGWPIESVTNGKMPDMLKEWEILVKFGAGDTWYSAQSISIFNKKFQELVISSKKIKKNADRSKENRGYTGATNGLDPNRIRQTGAGDNL